MKKGKIMTDSELKPIITMLYGGPYHEISVNSITEGIEGWKTVLAESNVVQLLIPLYRSIRPCRYELVEFPQGEHHFWYEEVETT